MHRVGFAFGSFQIENMSWQSALALASQLLQMSKIYLKFANFANSNTKLSSNRMRKTSLSHFSRCLLFAPDGVIFKIPWEAIFNLDLQFFSIRKLGSNLCKTFSAATNLKSWTCPPASESKHRKNCECCPVSQLIVR